MNSFRLMLVAGIQIFVFAMAESITVYKSPTCGCCSQWVSIMEEAGHEVTVHHSDSLQSIKDDLGLPPQLASCHSAVINGYVFEGHIPEADILSFLENPPQGARGLAVPGMPARSPGMARPGQSYKDFNVIAFHEDNRFTLYRKY
ncbi:DUF411 domain-containing protein [Reinekea marinisedimentorum]|uniref:CopG family transcriptional regulator n=1 Tax=Reinekea marinisedimentorum TaxID=230495 RepID=A0A4R3HWG7_9GAMM|nr:DUF411 domain-containing protein [Reinekea marinisedimentorum]TCS37124.1 hypothetical protein BCF53_12142 [Reinekea marinisedimentorum]